MHKEATEILDLDTTRDLPVKRPLSAYVHFLNEGREQLQMSHPHIGVIEQTTILGKRWRTLPKAQRQKYMTLAKKDQYRYDQEVQQLTFGLQEKPKEPVRARTPYMFFVRDCRDYVKKNMKFVPKRDIMLEVGKMWNEVKDGRPCKGVEPIAHYQNLAAEDLVRFREEHAKYVSTINSLRHRNVQGAQEQPVNA